MAGTREKRAAQAKQNTLKRVDGLENLSTRSGITGVSKRASNIITRNDLIKRNDVEAILTSEGLGSKIINRYPKDCTRKGFFFDGGEEEENKKLAREFKRLRGGKEFYKLLSWGRAFGAAIMVMIIDDGSDSLTEPLNENNIKAVDSLEVYAAGIDNNVTVSYDEFGKPEYYTVNCGKRFTVHHSRVIRYDAVDAPYYLWTLNNKWGLSILQDALGPIKQLLAALANGQEILDDWVIGVLSIENLFDLLRDPEQEKYLMKRIDGIDMTKNNANSIVIDTEESYAKHSTSASGVDTVIEKFFQIVAGITDYPMTVLFGTSPKGMDATGDSDLSLYYDMVGSMQENDYTPLLMPLFGVIANSDSVGFTGDIQDLEVKYFPLKEQTSKEIMEEFKTFSEASSSMLMAGVITEEEVRSNIGMKGYMSLDDSVSAEMIEATGSGQDA
jgi:phage-related protein (TIGR01555 family)